MAENYVTLYASPSVGTSLNLIVTALFDNKDSFVKSIMVDMSYDLRKKGFSVDYTSAQGYVGIDEEGVVYGNVLDKEDSTDNHEYFHKEIYAVWPGASRSFQESAGYALSDQIGDPFLFLTRLRRRSFSKEIFDLYSKSVLGVGKCIESKELESELFPSVEKLGFEQTQYRRGTWANFLLFAEQFVYYDLFEPLFSSDIERGKKIILDAAEIASNEGEDKAIDYVAKYVNYSQSAVSKIKRAAKIPFRDSFFSRRDGLGVWDSDVDNIGIQISTPDVLLASYLKRFVSKLSADHSPTFSPFFEELEKSNKSFPVITYLKSLMQYGFVSKKNYAY